ncbi:MAG: rhomboid family intramembrane serine protease [Gemmatimonadales bacterium]|nr:rhomboid family intramembrane serine protease [Gemmatimonadales bacterium]
MSDSPFNRITPWVGRLLAINAVVLLLQETLLTSDVLAQAVEFDPARALSAPWSFFTYMFVHGGLLHLLANSVALFVFGPPVERRLGSPVFILFYVYCGLGAAIVSLLATVVGIHVAPFVGASGAVLGVAFAFARMYPDAEMMIFPLPMPIKAKHLIVGIAVLDVAGAILGADNIAHIAHLGGMASALLFFALQGISHPMEPPRLPAMRRRVPVPQRDDAGGDGELRTRRAPAPTPAAAPDPAELEAAELDRVLDKISAAGIASLTEDEQRFLDGVSRRRKGELH